MAKGGDVILEIDFQGAQQIKTIFSNAVTLFILPPSYEELRSRLIHRGEDKPEVIELRLKNAATEIAQAQNFDFVIINESFEDALLDLQSIVRSQRLRFSVQKRTRASVFKALNIL
jgi:guanylate kinase